MTGAGCIKRHTHMIRRIDRESADQSVEEAR